MNEFRWNEWNTEHIAEHGITPEDAEYVVRHATWPYPSKEGQGKWLVRGQTAIGDFLQVVFVIDRDGDKAYVIHARPLRPHEIRRLRRRRR